MSCIHTSSLSTANLQALIDFEMLLHTFETCGHARSPASETCVHILVRETRTTIIFGWACSTTIFKANCSTITQRIILVQIDREGKITYTMNVRRYLIVQQATTTWSGWRARVACQGGVKRGAVLHTSAF